MHKRRVQSMHGGLWEFPGGKLERDESPQGALVRELREELGIEIDAGALQPVSFAASEIGASAADRPILMALYACRSWIGEPQCLEGEAIGWFAPGEIGALDMPPLDVPLAARLCEMLAAGVI